MLTDEEDSGEICCSPVHGAGVDQAGVGDVTTIEGALAHGQLSGPVVMTDALGLTWCKECLHRGEFINWGNRHGWPELEVHPYALLQGVYYWRVTATMADEDRVWSFLSLIEMLDKEESVA